MIADATRRNWGATMWMKMIGSLLKGESNEKALNIFKIAVDTFIHSAFSSFSWNRHFWEKGRTEGSLVEKPANRHRLPFIMRAERLICLLFCNSNHRSHREDRPGLVQILNEFEQHIAYLTALGRSKIEEFHEMIADVFEVSLNFSLVFIPFDLDQAIQSVMSIQHQVSPEIRTIGFRRRSRLDEGVER